ncbi:vWA domain-containing protein [Planctellipticum variicoloris]|uniref:vWA domain-containing protein n=1 Tax=Planctellipticum variicoloris TaxID=3064265 RepID=UPI003013B5F9|nr:VWA domain-containing protein [Planctomycetaceae bacterium SH412]
MSTGARVESEVFEMETDGGWLPAGKDISVWGLSLAVHVVVLLLLGTIHYEVVTGRVADITSILEDVDPTEYKFDSTVTDQIGSDSAIDTMAASQEAAQQVGAEPQEQIQEKLDENFKADVPVTDDIVKPAESELLSAVDTKGTNEVTGGVEGAIDRLAWEIANSLREKKTTVVWLFDVSPSLSKQREAIADRVEVIYKQLNTLNANADKALKTGIAAFGDKHRIVTNDLLDDTDEVVKAVRGLKSEDAGTENVFSAVTAVANKWQNQATTMRRNVMIIVVTDEAGSDPQMLEQAIVQCKRYGMKVYCVGQMAPFGRQEVEVPFTLESGETILGVMQRGPESYLQERVELPYWGVPSGDLQNIASGFGPYALTRLCAETNGLFFITDPGIGKVDLSVMRGYAPDYRPIRLLEQDVASNGAKRALIDVANSLKGGTIQIRLPRQEFPAENDNILKDAIAEAQKPLAELDYRLDQIVKRLEEGEKDRAKVREPRWQAGYDLALGRALALRVRSFGYNTMLAEMRTSPKPFEKKGSNQWRLVPSKEISSGAQVKKLSNKATEYLKRVIDQHAGTPWGEMAERELSQPLGWVWRENTYVAPAGGMGNGKNKPAPRFIEEVDAKTGKKTKRQLPDEPVRRAI